MFAQFGGTAASIAAEVESLGDVVTVTDGAGRILTVQGDKETLRRARDSNMAPWSCWSEWATGTNGMGTALEAPGAVLISGPEHWCTGFDEWICAGVAVRDPVTGDPVAVLDVSTWRANLPTQAAEWLSKAVGGARAILRQRAHDSGAELAAAFAQASARSGQALAALDASGKVVIADEEASLFLGVPARVPALDPAVRWRPRLDLRRLARHATKQARLDHGWVGSTQIATGLSSEPCQITLRPVFLADQPIGTLAVFGFEDGDPIEPEAPERGLSLPSRIVGVSDERMVLLHRPEVRFAEADGNDVWLVTRRGAPPGRRPRHRQARGGARRKRVPARPPALPRQPELRPGGRARAAGRAVADHGQRGPRRGARVAAQRPGRAAGAGDLDPRRPLDRAIDELVGLRGVARGDDALVMGREPADRIGGRRVAREPQRLAAAAAQSSSWRPSGHVRHGSCIQSVPRKRANASDSSQIQSSEWSRTLANSSPGIVDAAWQGSTSPLGAITIAVRPQPPMHGFGSSS